MQDSRYIPQFPPPSEIIVINSEDETNDDEWWLTLIGQSYSLLL